MQRPIVIHHASERVGDTAMEMDETHGPYQPMPAMFHLYVRMWTRRITGRKGREQRR
jgi:hypothetical protein